MKIVTSIIALAALSSCAMTSAHKQHGEKKAAQVAALLGVWESPCTPQDSGYVKTNRVFAAESVEIQNKRFVSDDCSGTPFEELRIQAAYAVGEGAPGDPTPIDIQYLSGFLTVNDATHIAAYNDQRLFDYDDWVAGKAREVTDRSPAPGQPPVVRKGETVYALFQVIDGKLHHSDFATGDGSTPAERPSKVRAGNADTKVN